MVSNEEIQGFDVQAYLNETMKSMDAQADADPQMGPVNTVTDKYDSETLNYLLNNITDSFHNYITQSIDTARLSDDAKIKLKLLASEFTDKEIVVALLKDYGDVKAQLNNFREVAKSSRLGMRRIDYIPEYFMIVAAIETHYKLKLTRAWKGFERVEQQTSRVKAEHSSSYADKTDRIEATGLKKMAMNLKGDQ